jgi:hypothetical protein
MTDDRTILVYAEAAPLSENVVTHGLYRAATPLLRAIRDRITAIALFPSNRNFRMTMLDAQLAPLCNNPPSILPWLRAAGRRLGAFDGLIERMLAAALIDPQVARSSAAHILCLEGSDPDVLSNVARIASRAGKPFSVYVVDDFITPMRLAGIAENAISATEKRARAALQQARHVFAISDGLGALFEKEFGVTATTLPLVFEPGPEFSEPVKKQIIFVGSVNFLYADALRALIEGVHAIREESGEDLRIRFTSPSAVELGTLPSFVQVEPLGSAQSLAREISASLFAFLPYSFEARVADMVRSSFPSKLMEYLAYARSIVAFTPEYANTTSYFRAYDLPELVHDRDALRLTIQRHLKEAPVFSDIYRRQLTRIHSPQTARETILSTLFGARS